MEEKITIEKLAEMTQSEFRSLNERMVTKELFKEGFDVLLAELKGLRSDFKTYQNEVHIEYAQLLGRVEVLEREMSGIKR